MKFTFPAGVLAQHTAVLGKTGSGKTSTAKLMIEQVVDTGSRVCILDPIKSDWWGLTSSRDGKRAGFPFVILGGPHGHVPLHSSAGKAIGELVAGGSLPLSIIDMADFEAGGLQRFFVDFAETIFKKNRGVLYLVIEEAHEFAPKERSGIGAENMSIHWAKKLATGTRTKGIRLIVATQRTQALHNAMIGSCDTVIAHRMTAPADQEPVIKWMRANAGKEAATKVADTLSNIRTGSGWLASGEAKLFEQVEFPRIHTYDNTATPTGDQAVDQVKTAPVDAEKLRAIIGDAVKEAEANDPAKLKARIAELERNAKVAAPPAATIDSTTAREYWDAGYHSGQTHIVDQLEVYYGALESWSRSMPAAPVFDTKAVVYPRFPTSRHASPTHVTKPAVDKPAAPVQRSAPRSGAAVSLPPGELAVLTACIQFPNGLRREQLTVLTQYKRSSRDAYIQRLREKGFVETVGDSVKATDAGFDALPHAEPLPTGADLQQHWLARLPEGERKILELLIEAYPNPVEREALTKATGYARSSRDAYLQRMRAKQLWTEPARGQVLASEDLF